MNKEFKQNIQVQINNEKARLLKLQEEFSKGKITEEEIDREDIEKLYKLYDEQIAQIEQSTEEYKRKIIEIRKKLAKN